MIITPSLFAGWEFENTANEIRGMTINSVGTGISYVDGIVGRATNYTITNTGINVGTTSTFNYIHGTGVFTICAWIRLTNYSATLLKTICSNSALSSASRGFGFFYDNRQLAGPTLPRTTRGIGVIVTTGVGTTAHFGATDAINDNNWHHVAVTTDHVTSAIYIDGVSQALVINTIGATSGLDAATNMIMGLRSTASDFKYEGDISNLYFFDTMLSQSNIQRIMHTMHPFLTA